MITAFRSILAPNYYGKIRFQLYFRISLLTEKTQIKDMSKHNQRLKKNESIERRRKKSH